MHRRSEARSVTVLGIDAGLAATGWGIVDIMGSKPLARTWGVVRTSSREGLAQRLATLFREIQIVIQHHHPDEIAIEDGFFGKNPRTALVIGQTRGIALLAAALAGLRVNLYPPAEVKLALTGSGSASKEQVAYMIRRLLGVREERIPSDCTDALAVALCRAQRMGFEERTKVSS